MQRKGHRIKEPKNEWQQRVHDPGAFKLDHLQSTKPIFAKWISTLLTLTWSISLFLHTVKSSLHSGPQKWVTPRGVWPWGIQVGPFAVHKTYFCKVNFHFITSQMQHFPFLHAEKGLQWTPWVVDTKGCKTLGHSSWTICSPKNLFLPNEFPLY